MRFYIFIVVTVSLMVVVALGLSCYLSFRRPMFHDNFGFHKESITPYWYPLRPAVDRHGNCGFADLRLNLFVIVVTNDRYVNCKFPHCRFSYAILLPGTSFETRVTSTTNRLVLIRGSEKYEFFLAAGDASRIYDEVRHIDANPGHNLLNKIVSLYEGADRSELMSLVSQLEAE